MSLTRTLTTPLAVVVLMAGQGCGATDGFARNGAEVPSAEVEAATPRGLAASLLAHLEPDEVVAVSGGQDGHGISAVVAISDPAIDSIYVSIADPYPGPLRCGGDSGFERISCTPGPKYTEVVARKSHKGQAPVYLGRAQTASRGHVLVMLYGQPSDAGLELLEALVKDPMVGLETSKARNLEGESIVDFGTLSVEATATRVSPGNPD